MPAHSTSEIWTFADREWRVRRPKPFVLVIEGPGEPSSGSEDYLHEQLLAPQWREAFLQVVDQTGLVVCLNVRTEHPSYRDVRGRSSKGRLSQGEYYHHDGCSSPQKPRLVEIRCPHQQVERGVATAVAPHHAVVRAMLQALPADIAEPERFGPWQERLAQAATPSDAELDALQGLMNRTVRRKLAAEEARAYFRRVDALANAYVEPWSMGESRLVANGPSYTGEGRSMQHRRAYLRPIQVGEANGSLVKRWTNEELPLPGQAVDEALVASFCSEEDGTCARRLAAQ
ncbi:hypothetical protein HNQ51_002813 [Inhella inkyongensis]|uniref:Uncharacterized protein n=1 Tax=Inhella inkyongensis TaxID=392593 RepID=A0A840S9N0_9BURK|nr:hypothetical protein [Inhella inkyongensis]MBB5205494.1 hypothetical protein [Inhella inkyongensis]